MMIFIGGIQPRTVRVEKHPQACPSCAHHDVYLKRVDQYISLFFIPMIRIKKGISFLVCENCGALPDQDAGIPGFRRPGKAQQCGFCGRAVDADFSYCPYCGRSL